MDKDTNNLFNNIRADIIANRYYGVTNPVKWPGSVVNNLPEFNNMCYGIVNRFGNPSDPDSIKYGEAGMKCQKAILDQIYMSGRTPCADYFQQPVIKPVPQNFKNAYLEEKDIDRAYNKCLSMCKDNECRLWCKYDKEALEETMKNVGEVKRDNCDCGKVLLEPFEYVEEKSDKFERCGEELDTNKDDLENCACKSTFKIKLGMLLILILVVLLLLYFLSIDKKYNKYKVL